MSYATSVAWSLIEPAGGGVDEDGQKTVTVEAGDGSGTWGPLGTASILLDRVGPTVVWVDVRGIEGWRGFVYKGVVDAGVGVLRTEVSLDGARRRSLDPSPSDFYARTG
jgi:hypothetical protein